MKIKRIELSSINENCYLVSSEKAAIVIDPGKYSPQICDFFNDNADKERLILITHCHFDHIGGVKRLSQNASTKTAIGKIEADLLNDSRYNLTDLFRMHYEPFSPDILLSNNEKLTVGDLEITVIHTPGHTKGGVCYLIDNCLFSGDTLFFESFGRTDFPSGDIEKLKESFYSLTSSLPPDTVVYPGHDQPTTIGHELNCNPILFMSIV